ncbi:MAG: hypothetical protein IV085_14255 [Thiobacillus sp.]|nr:hypothetical protein [Thiobacillus sp.]
MDSLFAVLDFQYGAGGPKSACDVIAEAAPGAVIDGCVIYAIDQGLHVRLSFFHGQWKTALAVGKQGLGLATQYVNARPDLAADMRSGADTPVMKNTEAGIEKNMPDTRSAYLQKSFSCSPPSEVISSLANWIISCCQPCF